MLSPRDALAHAFIAATLEDIRGWPAALQVELHQAVFTDDVALNVLRLRGAPARRWLHAWRTRVETPPPAPIMPYEIPAEALAWIAELAAAHRAAPAPPVPEGPASPGDLNRLAGLMERLGPLALALPWRREPPARA
jgi:hypothetical protein